MSHSHYLGHCRERSGGVLKYDYVAAVALANRLARIVPAVRRRDREYREVNRAKSSNLVEERPRSDS
jgi:hypothetical protein